MKYIIKFLNNIKNLFIKDKPIIKEKNYQNHGESNLKKQLDDICIKHHGQLPHEPDYDHEDF